MDEVRRLLALSTGTVEQIHAHAAAEYPDECCGVIVEENEAIQRVLRLRNVQDRMHAEDPERFPRTARTAYYPDSRDLIDALGRARAPGAELLAFYHSHPDHDAYFSDEDAAQATPLGEPSYPEAAQIVISVYEGRVRDTRAYAWSMGEGRYVEIPIERR